MDPVPEVKHMPWIRSSNVSLNTSRHIQNNFNYNCCYARPFWTTALRRLCFFLITGVKKKKGKKRAPNWASPIWKPTLASSHWGPGKAPGSFTCLHARPKAAISPNFWGLGYGLWLSNWLKIRFLVPRVRKFDTTVCTLHTDSHPSFRGPNSSLLGLLFFLSSAFWGLLEVCATGMFFCYYIISSLPLAHSYNNEVILKRTHTLCTRGDYGYV